MNTSYEMRVLAWLRHRLIQQEPQIWSGNEQIIVEEVRLEPKKLEENDIVILFREKRRPHCLFGFRTDPPPVQILTADGGTRLDEDPEGHAEVLYVNLKEQVEAADMGLPKDCTADHIAWITES